MSVAEVLLWLGNVECMKSSTVESEIFATAPQSFVSFPLTEHRFKVNCGWIQLIDPTKALVNHRFFSLKQY